MINRDVLYKDLMLLMSEIKIVRGPQELNYTLRNHPDIKKFLKSYQSESLNEIDKDIALLEI